MMALHVGLRRAVRSGGDRRLFWASWSRRPMATFELLQQTVTSRPPVLLVHGNRDDVIPPQALFQATEGLATLGIAG